MEGPASLSPQTSLAITGNPDFSATNSCGNSLAAHSACAISVAFNPHAVGFATATLSITDVYRTQTVTLSGTAIAPPGISLLPSTTVTFPSTGVSATSTSQLLTLTNNGGLPLLIESITLTGDFALAATGSTCSVSLAPGTACTVAVVFAPTTSGLRNGSLTIADNAPASQTAPIAGQQTVPLTGNAIDFALVADGPTNLTVTSGGNVTFPLLLSTPAALPGTVTLACTGVPANSICTLSSTTLPLSNANPTLVKVTLATGQSTPAQTAAVRAAALLPPDLSSRPKRSEVEGPASLLATEAECAALGPSEAVKNAVISTEGEAKQSRSGETPAFASARSATILQATGLALLLPLSLLSLRRRTLPTLLALTLVALLPIAGCSSTPRQIPGAATNGSPSTTSATPTPAGTYTLTVTATSAGLSRSINFAVTVQ